MKLRLQKCRIEHTRIRVILLLVAFLLPLNGSRADAQSPGFFSISVSGPPVIRETFARAISDDGAVIIGHSDTNYASPPDPADFRRLIGPTSATTVLLRDLDASFYDARVEQLSGDGQTLVGRYQYWNPTLSTGSFLAFAWSQAGGFQFLGDLPDGIGDNLATAASFDSGVVVGNAKTPQGMQPFRWTASDGMIGLGVLPGGTMYGEATDVSTDGSVVVGAVDSAEGLQAFRWTLETGLVGLGRLPGSISSRATAVSRDGQIVVGTSKDPAGNERAFRWTAIGGLLDLGDLPGGSITREPTGVSADGRTIVGSARTFATGDIGFVWTELRGMRSLPAMLAEDFGMSTGTWYATRVGDLSPNGRFIVGESVYFNDPTIIRGWGIVLPPIGDVSLDGNVTLLDLPIFVAYLTAPTEELSSRDRNLCDINRDGMLDGRDIAGFVNLLTGN